MLIELLGQRFNGSKLKSKGEGRRGKVQCLDESELVQQTGTGFPVLCKARDCLWQLSFPKCYFRYDTNNVRVLRSDN